jgi:hypothetical protein
MDKKEIPHNPAMAVAVNQRFAARLDAGRH